MAFEIIQGFNNSSNTPLDVRYVATSESDMLGIKWVYDGLIVARTDFSPIKLYTCNAAAATQPGTPDYTQVSDWDEFTGTPGVDGADGSQIILGSGVPSDLTGVEGDFFLDTLSGDYYQKGATVWGASQGNLVGPKGDTGTPGPAGADGDKYATTTNTDIDFTAATDPLTITVDQNLSWTVGQEVIVALQSDAVNVNLTGTVTSYLPTTSTNNMVISGIVYTGTGNQTGTFDVNLTGAPGAAGNDGNPGADGAAGIALIHDEADIELTAAKVTAVQGGNPFLGTPEKPYSASVQNDTRPDKFNTSGIEGDMSGHSISFLGASDGWRDNGKWSGTDGNDGYSPLEPTLDPSPQQTANGNWWIDDGTKTSTYKDTLIPGTGPQGDTGEGVVNYTYAVTSSTNATLQYLALNVFDFSTPCELHLTITSGVTFTFTSMASSGLSDSKLRRVTVTVTDTQFANGQSVLNPSPIRVSGSFQGNNLLTYGPNVSKTSVYVNMVMGEFGVFTPVYRGDGSYQGTWLANIVGRGLEVSNRDTNYSTVSLVSSESDKWYGMWTFRVSDGICHYSGKFKIKTHDGTNSVGDYFKIGPSIIYPYLPDPGGGTISYTGNSSGPGNFLYPLNVTSKFAMYPVYGNWFPIQGTLQPGEFYARLVYIQNNNAAEDLRINVSVINSQTNANNWYTIAGSYPVASPYTANKAILGN